MGQKPIEGSNPSLSANGYEIDTWVYKVGWAEHIERNEEGGIRIREID